MFIFGKEFVVDDPENIGASKSIADVVQDLMDAPFRGAETPVVHKRMVESQKAFVARVFEELLSQVSEGNSVKVKNFGNFSLRLTKNVARNPQTGESVPVKNRKRLRFSASVNADRSLNVNLEE
jgi:nucleoid DNA-binding protein